MSIADATRIAEWLEETYATYLVHVNEGGDRVKYEGSPSGDWDAGGSIRVSKLAKDCPKLSAAITKEQIGKTKFGLHKLARFDEATRIAEGVYEAIQWGCDNNKMFSLRTELRIHPGEHWTGLVGTIDAVLRLTTAKWPDGLLLPIEVKSTNVDSWYGSPRGIAFDQMLQCVGEMILLSEENKFCPFGYVLTRYGYKDDVEYTDGKVERDALLKVWTVMWSDEFNGWFLYDGPNTQSTTSKFWPTLHDGRIFLSLEHYNSIKEQHELYMNYDSPIDADAPYKLFENWRCAKVKQPEYYALTGKYKGAKKDGTGIVTPRCALFDRCFAHKLALADLKPGQKEYPLERLENLDG